MFIEAASFPRSISEFRRLFRDERTCATYLECMRWSAGFVCPRCGKADEEPYRFANRPGVLRCRHCRHDVSLTRGTIMENSRTPLLDWFSAAYLLITRANGISATELQQCLKLPRYETAFEILRKLRACMAQADCRPIGDASTETLVEVGVTYLSNHACSRRIPVAGAIQLRARKNHGASPQYAAGPVRLAILSDTSCESLGAFVQSAVVPNTAVVGNVWGSHIQLANQDCVYTAVSAQTDGHPALQDVFCDLEIWLRDVHHGVSPKHLPAYLGEFAFRFNRRYHPPYHTFRSLLVIASGVSLPSATPSSSLPGQGKQRLSQSKRAF